MNGILGVLSPGDQQSRLNYDQQRMLDQVHQVICGPTFSDVYQLLLKVDARLRRIEEALLPPEESRSV